MPKPIIILAFADYRTDREKHLRELDEEHYGIQKALEKAEGKICRVVSIPGATVEKIVAAFDEAEGPVVGFHFAGHANGYQLLLRESADGPAFAAFLGRQSDLKFVFLNACSTKGHVEELHRNGVPVVIATSSSIDDRIAREFAVSFYTHLAKGKSIQAAFQYYETIQDIKKSGDRGISMHREKNHDYINFPWKLACRPGAERILEWNLSIAAADPLFGLPPIPRTYDLPATPFRYLERFERKHAPIFFGRGYQIKELYEKVTDPILAPVVLFFGQSGVGKSSLLEAGLIPRLETAHEVRHLRRNAQQGLEKDLADALGDPADIAAAWKRIESETGKPLILILDQVEEVFTKPLGKNSAEELPALLNQLKLVFEHREARPGGKVILSYRKEYHPDIEVLMSAFTLPHTDVFLQKLDQAGIKEAIAGLTADERLQKQYGLEIVDARLPDIVADDLLEDASSAIAPILQILLTKMWEEAVKVDQTHPRFSIELYQSKKREGYLLYDFLDQKIREISSWNREAVDSGLVLDLLMFHTTPRSTANQRRLEEITARYADREEIIHELLLQIRDKYLLVEAPSLGSSGSPALVLAHDTLAPIVRQEYDKSDRPGQMADRILSNRFKEWQQDPKNTWLDENSLEIVQKGRPGMRVWLVDEEKLVADSRERLAREKRFRRNVRVGAIISAAVLLLLAGLFWFQRREAARQAYDLKSNALIDEGQNLLDLDPTQALELIYQGWRMDTADLLKSNVFFAGYRDNVLYDTASLFMERGGNLIRAAFSEDGQYVATAAGSVVRLYAYQSGVATQVDSFQEAKNTVSALAFSPDGRYVLAGSYDRNVYRWPVQGAGVDSFPTPKSPGDQLVRTIVALASSLDNRWVALAYLDGGLGIWHPADTGLNRRIDTESPGRALAFLPAGDAFLAGMADGQVRRYDLDGTNQPLDALRQMESIAAIGISPSGDDLLIATSSKFSVWRQTGSAWEPLHSPVTLPAPLQDACLAASGRLVLTACVTPVGYVWEAATGRLLRTLRGHAGNLRSIGADTAAEWLFTAAEDSTVRRWQLPFDLPLRRFPAGEYLFSALAATPVDGQTVALGTLDGQVVLLNIESGHPEIVHEAHEFAPVTALDYEPVNRLLVSGDDTGQSHIWQITATSRTELRSDTLHRGAIRALAIAPGGEWAATAGDDSIAVLWNLRTGEKKALRGHEQEVLGVAFSPDGKTLLTTSLDHTARSWSVPDGKSLRSYPHPGADVVSVAFLPGNAGFVTGTANPDNAAGSLHFWHEGNSETPIREYNLPAGVEALSVSPAGSLLTVALADGTIQLRDGDGNLLRSYRETADGPPGYALRAAVLTGDTHKVISLTDQAEVFLWRNDRPLPRAFFESGKRLKEKKSIKGF